MSLSLHCILSVDCRFSTADPLGPKPKLPPPQTAQKAFLSMINAGSKPLITFSPDNSEENKHPKADQGWMFISDFPDVCVIRHPDRPSCREDSNCLFCAGIRDSRGIFNDVKARLRPLAQALKSILSDHQYAWKTPPTQDNTWPSFENLQQDLLNMADFRKNLSYFGAVKLNKAQAKSAVTTKALKKLAIEILKPQAEKLIKECRGILD